MKFHSFSGRITRRIVVSMLALMSVVALLVFLFARREISALTSVHFQDVLENTNDKVEGMLDKVEISTGNNLAEIEEHLGSPEEVFDALEKELRLNPHIVGCAVGFNPDYFPEEGRWFEPYVARREDGTIERLQIGSESHDYLNAEWFQETLAKGEGHWSNPYYDEAGAKAVLITFSAPVVDREGRVVGVFGADFPLAWLYEQLIQLDEQVNRNVMNTQNERIYCFLLGRDGVYIAHPERERSLTGDYFDYAGTEMAEEYRQIGEEMLEGKSGNRMTYMDGIKSVVYYRPLSRAGWSMAVVVPTSVLYRPGRIIATIILILLAIGLLVTSLISGLSARRATRPLKYLAASAEEIAQGNFNAPLPEIKEADEIRLLRDSFEDMQHSLSSYIDKLTAATAQRASLENELNIARNIQMAMVPKTFPPYPERKDLDIYGRLTPAKAVGGDMFDFVLRDDRLFFCIGDVSGKGIPAALWMAMIIAAFRTQVANEDHPEKIVTTLNDALAERNELMMFATFFLGVLDLRTGVLTYCNAGHEAPLLLGGDQPEFLDIASNLPLGVMPKWDYAVQQQTLARGTTLFLYTDGVSEAENQDQAQFGRDTIVTVLRNASADAETLVETITGAVQDFVGDAEQSDDLTLLACRYP
ncbi:MAG: SpoIIE family protein phosphatase [Bacteroidales bacterium]|nr:SpoIIE family protein phosphatase [Bacteroidales bacterium]